MTTELKMDAAIEWHYVADGPPPRSDEFLVSHTDESGDYQFVNEAFWFANENKFDCHNVYAWAEMPKPAPYSRNLIFTL